MTGMARTSKALGQAYIRVLIAALVFLFAFAISFGVHQTALGIVFVVLFALSLITAAVLVALTVRRGQAELNAAMREEAELRNRRLNG